MKKRVGQASSRVTVRLPPALARELEAAAGAAGMNVAAWARAALSEAARDGRRADELAAQRAELAALRAATLDCDYFIVVMQHFDKKMNALLEFHQIQMPGE